MNFARDQYRALCDRESTIPLFSQAWWLDALAGEGRWDVALVEKNGQSLHAYGIARFGRIILGHPPLTQTLGHGWMLMASCFALGQTWNYAQLIAALPRYDHFSENWHFKQTNWLPFYWLGFTQTTYYTYRLSMLSDQQKLWNSFRENIRREIRKAERRYQLRVRTDLGVDAFLQLNAQTFKRQGHNIPYSKNLVARLDDACVERHARRIFSAEDAQGRAHAGIYLV